MACGASIIKGSSVNLGGGGYGSFLLIGVESEELPERDASGRRSEPPYGLQTSDADRRISGAEESADWNSDLQVAERAERLLVVRKKSKGSGLGQVSLICGGADVMLSGCRVHPEPMKLAGCIMPSTGGTHAPRFSTRMPTMRRLNGFWSRDSSTTTFNCFPIS